MGSLEEGEGICLLLAVPPAEAGATGLRAAATLGAPAAAEVVPAACAEQQTPGPPGGQCPNRAPGLHKGTQDKGSFLVEG